MHVQRWRDQKQQWLLDRQLSTRKISKALEFPSFLVPSHPRPVVESLLRQMDVLVSLELNHRQPSFARDREHINHGSIGGRKRRTCEYKQEESSRSSITPMFFTTSDSSQRSECNRHNG